MKSVFSAPGTYIPGKKITLGKGVIRGVESHGMLCSGAELELSDDHDGILDLPEDAPVGVAYAQWAGLDDPIIEINLMPNRPDAAGRPRHCARSRGGGAWQFSRARPFCRSRASFPAPFDVTLDFTPRTRISRRSSRCASCAASQWAKPRTGCRSGSRRSGCGRSMRLSTSPIISPSTAPARCMSSTRKRSRAISSCAARSWARTLLALDGRTYALDESMVVIADDNGVESLAGIMGGQASGCDETTTDVLIETALWDPMNIARQRPQARHQLRRALSLRTRRRSGILPAGNRTCDAARARALRRRRRRNVDARRRDAAARQARSMFPWSEVKRLTGLDSTRREDGRHSRTPRVRTRSCAGKAPQVVVKAPSFRPGHRGQGRSRRGNRADRRRRRVCPRRRCRAPTERRAGRADVAAKARPQRQTGARRPWPCRSGDLVLRLAGERAEVFGGGAPALALANPDCPGAFRHAAEPAARAVAAAQRNADRGHGDGPVRGRPDLPRRHEDRPTDRRGGRQARTRRRRAALVGAARAKRAPSTPRATSWRCSTRSASRPAACRSFPAVRHGFIPAARRPCNSGQRRLSAISANCIRAR